MPKLNRILDRQYPNGVEPVWPALAATLRAELGETFRACNDVDGRVRVYLRTNDGNEIAPLDDPVLAQRVDAVLAAHRPGDYLYDSRPVFSREDVDRITVERIHAAIAPNRPPELALFDEIAYIKTILMALMAAQWPDLFTSEEKTAIVGVPQQVRDLMRTVAQLRAEGREKKKLLGV